MKAKKLMILLASATLVISMTACGSSSKSSDTSTASTTEESTTTDTTDDSTSADTSSDSSTAANTLEALPSGLDIDDLTDCTVKASFTTDSFDWMGGNLTMDVYDDLLYDTVDVSQLKVGDSMVIGDYTLEVADIQENDYGLEVTDTYGTGYSLRPQESGGVYKVVVFDDAPEMQEIGEVQLPLSSDIVLHDCTDDPSETVDISADEIKSYMEGLTESRATFSALATEVVIENGEITEITRSWRP